ncbi:MAG: transposase [Nodosilinea sp.]
MFSVSCQLTFSPSRHEVSSLSPTSVRQSGCELLFLPPYSPDFNKIEKFWARLKQYLGQTLALFDCL